MGCGSTPKCTKLFLVELGNYLKKLPSLTKQRLTTRLYFSLHAFCGQYLLSFRVIYLHITIIRLVALFIIAQFSVAQIAGCHFYRGYIDVAFFLLRSFSLSIFPVAQFSVAVFTMNRICSYTVYRESTV